MLSNASLWSSLCVSTRFRASVVDCDTAVCDVNYPVLQFGVRITGKGLECDAGL
jgi:hypothetical protein